MSRGYYGIINDTIYEMIGSDHNIRGIAYAPRNLGSVSSRCLGSGRYDISVNLSDLTENALSNQEVVTDAIAKLETDKTTEIVGLDNNFCKMIVNYRLISGTIDCPKAVSDEGAMVQNVTLKPVLFPLGLTDDNEYVSRWALTTGAVTLKRNYVQSAPIGISRHRESNYVLVIDRITLIQRKYTDIREVDIHPSIEYYNDMYPSSDRVVTIYDSASAGFQIDPIYLPTAPSAIDLHIGIDLNDFFVVAERTDITDILDKNNEANKPGYNDGSQGTLDPDHKDDKSDIGSEDNGTTKPDKPNTPDPGKDDNTSGSDSSDSNTPSETPDDNKSDSGSEPGSESSSDGGTTPSETPSTSESDSSKTDSSETPSGSETDDSSKNPTTGTDDKDHSASEGNETADSKSDSSEPNTSESTDTSTSESGDKSEENSESQTNPESPDQGDTDHSASEGEPAGSDGN